MGATSESNGAVHVSALRLKVLLRVLFHLFLVQADCRRGGEEEEEILAAHTRH
jgi:hypothetical protein